MTEDRESAAGGPSAYGGPFARLGAEIDNLLRTVMPSDKAAEHFLNARVEVLKGVRALIDGRIERLSSKDRKGVSIDVE